jgi:predicted extracellular nuclease
MQWHINADEPAALDYRMTNQPALYSTDFYRSSQHDPLLIDMLLTPGGWPATMYYLPVVLAARP